MRMQSGALTTMEDEVIPIRYCQHCGERSGLDNLCMACTLKTNTDGYWTRKDGRRRCREVLDDDFGRMECRRPEGHTGYHTQRDISEEDPFRDPSLDQSA